MPRYVAVARLIKSKCVRNPRARNHNPLRPVRSALKMTLRVLMPAYSARGEQSEAGIGESLFATLCLSRLCRETLCSRRLSPFLVACLLLAPGSTGGS